LRGRSSLAASEFFGRIDVAEGFGLIVKGDFGNPQGSVPEAYLATARRQKGIKPRQKFASHQAKRPVRPVSGACHGKFGAFRFQRGMQSRDEIGRQKGRIAGHGHQ